MFIAVSVRAFSFSSNRLNSRVRNIAEFISTVVFACFARSKIEKVATKCRKITKGM